MLKNIEWGAIAYLTTSIYGQGLNEVRINNSSTFITGCAATRENGTSYNGCENAYNKSIGYLASTTGNISGIYDMSGGSSEYVMGVLEDNLNSNTPLISLSGFTIFPEYKYYDIYRYGTNEKDYTRYHLGDSTIETKGWNHDYASFVYDNKSWFVRGLGCNYTTSAGIFAFNNLYGHGASGTFSARAILR